MRHCPFCGSLVAKYQLGPGTIECQFCGAHGPHGDTEELALSAWDARVEEPMDFFDQLQIFSERYFRTLHIAEDISPWGCDGWSDDGPIGAGLHYTADDDFERVVKWFMREKFQARVSAHVVVADRKYASMDDLMDGLPLVKELPVTVVQCRPPDMPAWHASWTNDRLYGLELLNVGELRQAGDGWVSHWRRDHDPDEPEWTMPWKHPLKTPCFGWQRYWEPYTGDQIKAVVMILRHLRALYPQLDPSWVVGHEVVQGRETIGARGHDKRDPGPHLPVWDIRQAVFNAQSPTYEVGWLSIYEREGGSDFSQKRMTRFVQEWVMYELRLGWEERKQTWAKDHPDRDFNEPEPSAPSDAVAWERFNSAVRAMASRGGWGVVGKTALRLLGYHVPRLHADMYDEDRTAIKIFQKLMGLKPDAIPGPKTRKAIVERLEDRGILAA